MVTSLTVSPISWTSPSMRVIRSYEVFEAFEFFRDPTCSLGYEHFNLVHTACGFAPPCSILVSSSGKGDFYPSRSSSTIFCYSSANFVMSCAAWALATASSFLCFSANYATHNFTSYFFWCTTDISASTTELAGARHSGGHDSRTEKMTSSVTR